MIESVILGIVQGIAEWLPISSEGLLVLLRANLFGQTGLGQLIEYALFLHLGTFLAALIYFRKEIIAIFKQKRKEVLNFYIIATVISGIIGFALLNILMGIGNINARGINLLIGSALIVTAFLQFKRKGESREEKDLKTLDAIILGCLQGLAVVPGLSRSGLTVSGLLLRKFNETTALKISFIMSLPVVLAANIFSSFHELAFSLENLIGLFFSFIFGILTIHLLLKFSQKVNFAWFVLVFGLIVIISTFI